MLELERVMDQMDAAMPSGWIEICLSDPTAGQSQLP